MFSNSVQSESILILGNFSPTAEKGEASEEERMRTEKILGGKEGKKEGKGEQRAEKGCWGKLVRIGMAYLNHIQDPKSENNAIDLLG